MNKIKILVADDQSIVAEGLCALLSLDSEMEIIDRAENGQEALDVLEESEIDVILMDIRMPVMNGVECTKIVKEKYPDTKVLILTTFDDDRFILDALDNGASGYLLKDLTAEKLSSAIKDVHQGNAVMHQKISQKILSGISREPKSSDIIKLENGELLTSREISILKLVGQGKTNDEISEILYLSTGTIKNYITSLYDKLNIKGRTKLMAFALDSGIV